MNTQTLTVTETATAQEQTAAVCCPNCQHAIPMSVVQTAMKSARVAQNRVYRLEGTAAERKDKVTKMPPQARACLAIIESLELDEIMEEDLMKAVAEQKDLLRTKQDPWRIFQYYRAQMNGAGIFSIA